MSNKILILNPISLYRSFPLFMIPLWTCEYFVTSAVMAAVTSDLCTPYQLLPVIFAIEENLILFLCFAGCKSRWMRASVKRNTSFGVNTEAARSQQLAAR